MSQFDDLNLIKSRLKTNLQQLKANLQTKNATLTDDKIEDLIASVLTIQTGGGPAVTKTEMVGDSIMLGVYMNANNRNDDFFSYISKAIYPISMNNFASYNNKITKIPSDFDMSHVTGSMCKAFHHCTNLAGTVDFKEAKPSNIDALLYDSNKVEAILNLNTDYLASASTNKPFPNSFAISFATSLNRLTFDCSQVDTGKFVLDVSFGSFTRASTIEMFNSLPVNTSTNTTYNTISLHGNPCVNGTGEQLTEADKSIAILKGWNVTV